MSLIFASRCSSVSRFVLHVQTDDTFPNKPNRFHMWQDRSERVGAPSSHQRDHTSIQQFIKAHFLLFYWQTDTTVVIILLSDSMKSNCCRSFCWQAPVSLPQASVPTRRTALTYKSFNGNQYGSPSHRTAQNLSACSSFYFYTKRRQKIWINVKKETCSWTPSVILQVSHIYNKTETL